MSSKGMYLSLWTLHFNPEQEITTTPVWVRLTHLPLILSDDGTLKEIGNKLGHYLDRAEPKGNLYSCARICVEVDLEKGVP